jgi:voltage-gated potassium channel
MSFKQRVHELLEPGSADDRASRLVDGGLMILIALNVLAMVLETIERVHALAPEWFWWFEVISVGIFTVEYLLRVWSCTASARFARPVRGRARFMMTPLAVIDLLVILPFWLPMLGVDLRVVRSIRLFRVFRLLKLGRYSTALQTFGRVLTSKREDLLATILLMGLLLLLGASFMYYVEHEVQPEQFPSIPETMWWGIATLTTVGYGDVYPMTHLGRLLGAVIMVLGIGMFALPTGILGAAFVEELQRTQAQDAGGRCCPHCGKPIDGDGG